jgi:hypothetical protein
VGLSNGRTEVMEVEDDSQPRGLGLQCQGSDVRIKKPSRTRVL